MEKTNIEYFNSYFKLFINNIIDTFSETKDILNEYYSPLLETEDCNDDKYVKRFMKKFKEHKNLISNKDDKLFTESIYILKNLDFKIIWESEELSDSNKDKIWEYLQTLYIIGETIISDSEKVKNLIDNFKKIKDGESLDEDNTDKEILDMFKNISENSNNNIDENFLENCSLGKLATELTGEIDLEDMNLNVDDTSNPTDMFNNLISGENSLNFMNLIQKVGNKIQSKIETGEFDQERLMTEAQQMMSSLQGSGLDNMFSNMAQATGGSLNPTQERLRKKLEKRNKK